MEMEKIITAVERHLKCKPGVSMINTRRRESFIPRSIAIYFMKMAGYSEAQIAAFYKKDRSTIYNAIYVVEGFIGTYSLYSHRIIEIKDILFPDAKEREWELDVEAMQLLDKVNENPKEINNNLELYQEVNIQL